MKQIFQFKYFKVVDGDEEMSDAEGLQARVEREREAHDERDVLAENIRIKNRFSHIWTFPSRVRFYNKIDSYLTDLAGKSLLDYGCGRGETSLKYMNVGAAHITGIDISTVFIEDARSKMQAAGIDKSRYGFYVMDAHALDFKDECFDLIVGFGILHHLDATVALSEIHRVLKPGGRVLLQEPLADNPLLRLFRLLTPNARTEDEEPFSRKAVLKLTSNRLWNTELFYCGILEAPVAMFTSVLMPKSPNNWALRVADKIEKRLHSKKVLLNWNQYICFNMTKRIN